jgi:hypothetical protein
MAQTGEALEEPAQRQSAEQLETTNKRPVLVTVIAVLVFLKGASTLVILALPDELLAALLVAFGGDGTYGTVMLIGSAVLPIITAFAIFSARKWAWWLATTTWCYGVLGGLIRHLPDGSIWGPFGESPGQVPSAYQFPIVYIVFACLFLSYFLSAKVSSYFGVARLPAWKRLGVLVAASAVLCAAFAGLDVLVGA